MSMNINVRNDIKLALLVLQHLEMAAALNGPETYVDVSLAILPGDNHGLVFRDGYNRYVWVTGGINQRNEIEIWYQNDDQVDSDVSLDQHVPGDFPETRHRFPLSRIGDAVDSIETYLTTGMRPGERG